MNRVSFVSRTAACLAFAFSLPSFAQDGATAEPASEPTGYRNVELVETGPFRMENKRGYENLVIVAPQFIPPGVRVRYDRLLADNFSLVTAVSVGAASVNGGAGIFSVGGTLGGNWHPLKNGMHGFFLGPRVSMQYYGIDAGCGDEACADGSVTTFGAGAIVGWRWIWNPGFSLGLGVGAQYATIVSEAEARSSDGSDAVGSGFSFSGILPDFELNIGWAF